MRHTRSGKPGGLITLLIFYPDDATARIEVIDDGAATVPSAREPDLNSLSGRGLWMVGQISAAWGVRATPDERRAVWVLMPTTGDAPDLRVNEHYTRSPDI